VRGVDTGRRSTVSRNVVDGQFEDGCRDDVRRPFRQCKITLAWLFAAARVAYDSIPHSVDVDSHKTTQRVVDGFEDPKKNLGRFEDALLLEFLARLEDALCAQIAHDGTFDDTDGSIDGSDAHPAAHRRADTGAYALIFYKVALLVRRHWRSVESVAAIDAHTVGMLRSVVFLGRAGPLSVSRDPSSARADHDPAWTHQGVAMLDTAVAILVPARNARPLRRRFALVPHRRRTVRPLFGACACRTGAALVQSLHAVEDRTCKVEAVVQPLLQPDAQRVVGVRAQLRLWSLASVRIARVSARLSIEIRQRRSSRCWLLDDYWKLVGIQSLGTIRDHSLFQTATKAIGTICPRFCFSTTVKSIVLF
jgi:hypothetical protein